MATRTVQILILGDAKQAIAEIDKLASDTATKSETMGAKFADFGKKVALVTGAAGLAVAAFSVKMADDFEKSHARLVTALKDSGQSVASWSKGIGQATDQGQKFGFNASEIENSLSRLVPATKNSAQANRDLSIAENIAAKQHIDLESATGLLVKTEGGRYVGLTKTLGVSKDVINSFKSQADAIAYLNSHFAGQASAAADTFGGKLKAVKAEVENLGIKIGTALIPVVETLVGWVTTSVSWLEQHKTVAAALGVVVGTVLVGAMTAWIATLVKAAAVNVAGMFTGLAEGAQVAALHIATTSGSMLVAAGAVGLLAGGLWFGMKALGLFDDTTKPLILDLNKLGSSTVPQLANSLDKLTQSQKQGYVGGQVATGAYEHMGDAVNQEGIAARNTAMLHDQFNTILAKSPQYADKFIAALQDAGINTSWYVGKLSAHAEQMAKNQVATDAFKTKLDYLTQGYNEDTAAILANQQTLDKSIDPQLNAAKAVLATNQALRDLAAAAFESANGTSKSAEANDAYTGKLIDAKAAIEAQTTAQLKAGESNVQVKASLDAVAATLSPDSPLRQFIESYETKLNMIPANAHTTVTADVSQASAQLDIILGKIHNIKSAAAITFGTGSGNFFNLDGSPAVPGGGGFLGGRQSG